MECLKCGGELDATLICTRCGCQYCIRDINETANSSVYEYEEGTSPNIFFRISEINKVYFPEYIKR